MESRLRVRHVFTKLIQLIFRKMNLFHWKKGQIKTLIYLLLGLVAAPVILLNLFVLFLVKTGVNRADISSLLSKYGIH